MSRVYLFCLGFLLQCGCKERLEKKLKTIQNSLQMKKMSEKLKFDSHYIWRSNSGIDSPNANRGMKLSAEFVLCLLVEAFRMPHHVLPFASKDVQSAQEKICT